MAFRRHRLLPLDDCLYAPQPSIPHLTRSALHRRLQRHGISRLPDVEDDKPKRQKFKTLGGLAPYGYTCKIWTTEPERAILNSIHQMPGLNIWEARPATRTEAMSFSRRCPGA